MSAMMKSAVQSHNEKAATTWSAPGDLYDEISRGRAGAINHCIDRLQIQPDDKVLDLACGTGWASRTIAALNNGARLFGVDIAHGPIESAKKVAKRSNLAIEYLVGDAEQLPCEDGFFDAVISSFGIMFVSKPEAAAGELPRVVKQGGRFGILVWKPDSAAFEMFKVMKPYLPVPLTPAPPSPFAWGSRDRIKELLGEHWALRFEEGVSPFLAASPETAWELWTSSYGPTKMLASNLPPDRREQFKSDMITFHNRFRTELGVYKAAGVFIGSRHSPLAPVSRAKITGSPGMEIGSNEAIKQSVQAGLGLGLLSRATIEQELTLKRLVVLDVEDFPIMRHWFVVHRRGKRLSAAAEAFKRFTMKEALRLMPTAVTGQRKAARARPRRRASTGR